MNVIDLFAGAGGLSLGFMQAGFTPIAAIDNWRPAVETYRGNIGEHVALASFDEGLALPESTVVVGGPPCQGFSSAGLRRSVDGRNALVGGFARLVARLRPESFVFENVEGFLTGGGGAFVFELLDPILEAGYWVHLRKVNAANYGVPQHRKRVLAVGGKGFDPGFPEPTHLATGMPGADRVSGVHLLPAATAGAVLDAVADRLSAGPVPDHEPVELQGEDLRRAKLLAPGQKMSDLPEDLWHPSYRRRALRRVMDGTPSERRGGPPSGIRRLRADHPSKAVTGAAVHEFVHPWFDRTLTARECASLQTFPMDYRFFGSRNETLQLIGNAVPPVFARAVAERLKQGILDGAFGPKGARGRLLSYMPTAASGMSPALAGVSSRVAARYGVPTSARKAQLALWD